MMRAMVHQASAIQYRLTGMIRRSWPARSRRVTGLALLLFVVLSSAHANPAHTDHNNTLLIASAANFQNTLEKIADAFVQQAPQHNTKVRIASAASGNLYQQIRHGAPYQLFFSADAERPIALEQAGLSLSRQTYAYGRLVIASQQPIKAESPKALATALAQQLPLSIANPTTAPYGKAAAELLQTTGLALGKHDKAIAANVSLAYSHCARGLVGAAMVASALVHNNTGPNTSSSASANDNNRCREVFAVPASWHQPIEQQMLVLKNAGQTAQDFAAFMSSETARIILQNDGYLLP